jgi:hypothetical protein
MARRQPHCPASASYRRNHAPDGIHEERLPRNMAYSRERITLPMTLLPVLMGKTIDDLHAARTGTRPDGPAAKENTPGPRPRSR